MNTTPAPVPQVYATTAEYQLAVEQAYITDGQPLTPARLREIALAAEIEYLALLKDFPPGTVHDRRNITRDVHRAALACAAWLEAQPVASRVYLGPFGPPLPRPGRYITVRKGVLIHGTGPGIAREGELTKRSYAVRVRTSSPGFLDASSASAIEGRTLVHPKVEWAGAGGYWRWTDAENVLSRQ